MQARAFIRSHPRGRMLRERDDRSQPTAWVGEDTQRSQSEPTFDADRRWTRLPSARQGEALFLLHG